MGRCYYFDYTFLTRKFKTIDMFACPWAMWVGPTSVKVPVDGCRSTAA